MPARSSPRGALEVGRRAGEAAGGEGVLGVVGDRERAVEVAARISASTGPKISSVAIRERGSVTSTTVGPAYQPDSGTSVRCTSTRPSVAASSWYARTRSSASASISGPTTVAGSRGCPIGTSCGRTREPLGQRVEDVVDDDDARRSGALLARVAERALHDRGHRVVEVGVRVDDDRVLAAHLRDDALHVPLARDAPRPRAG